MTTNLTQFEWIKSKLKWSFYELNKSGGNFVITENLFWFRNQGKLKLEQSTHLAASHWQQRAPSRWAWNLSLRPWLDAGKTNSPIEISQIGTKRRWKARRRADRHQTEGDHVVEKKIKFYFTTLGILKLKASHMVVFGVLCLRGWYIYIGRKTPLLHVN